MGRSPGIHPPVARRFRLANGLRVILAPLPQSPTVSVWVWYSIGSRQEWPGITGASHWIEHLLFQGSPRYGKGEIDRAILEVGGTLNAFTDNDFTAYFSTVPRDRWAIPLDIEADRMTRALLDDAEVERERRVVLSEREGNENWPEFRVEEELYQLAFRQHPYRWDALGRREDIERITPDELRTYYRRYYGPRNATLIVAGAFDVGTLRGEVERRFEGLLASGELPAPLPPEPAPSSERRATLRGPGTTAIVQFGWRAPSLDPPDTPALLALDALLGGEVALFQVGGSGGHRSDHPGARLYRALVDSGLAVRASSHWPARVDPGLFTIQVQAAPRVSVGRIEAAVLAETERLTRRLPSTRELAEIRTRARRGVEAAYEGASRTAFRLGFFETLGGRALEGRLYRAFQQVSGQEIREAARRVFVPEGRSTVIYEPLGGPDHA
ncbi:MAG: pitrilysin family protein [Thermoplasmata archaeon]|jgi:zinc protease